MEKIQPMYLPLTFRREVITLRRKTQPIIVSSKCQDAVTGELYTRRAVCRHEPAGLRADRRCRRRKAHGDPGLSALTEKQVHRRRCRLG
ncbi:hypothetical protein [Bacteroides caecimuris]|uniref:hypothetical protein n=1 Tax=Bacteroides caecimuris TaxID=1796613 RepID=UPI0026F159BC|nr:hypothetical protein [Bacteroides caecimuris]